MYKGFFFIKSGPHKGKSGECVGTVDKNGETICATLLCGLELCDVAPFEVVTLPIIQGYMDIGDRSSIAL